MNQIALGKRIRSERRARGLTQEQLAEKVDLSTTYIGFIERGERTMTLNTLTTIANELHVSVDYLLQDVVPLDSSAHTNRLNQLWSSASPSQQEMILNLIQTVLNSPLDC